LIARNESAATRRAGRSVAPSGDAATLGAAVVVARDVHAIAAAAIPATKVALFMARRSEAHGGMIPSINRVSDHQT
jgi:hypothetical protein